jgi:hypothetical protein
MCTIDEMQNLPLDSLNSTMRIQGLTHNYYRYPARFSPEFAREVIGRFSQPGDCVLDAFMGGGTTIVEAIAAGRKAIGVDINSLACFITSVKTTPLSNRDQDDIIRWSEHFKLEETPPSQYENNINDERLRNLPYDFCQFMIPTLRSLNELQYPRQQRFVRCALLKVGQWATECRQIVPTVNEIKTKLQIEIRQMLLDMGKLVASAKEAGIDKNKITNSRTLIHGSITDLATVSAIKAQNPKPTLVLTSPPYPGVHVLYHRWQISGRKETPAPYWFAGLQDGRTTSYFTMGSRSVRGIRQYFDDLKESFCAIRSVTTPSATIVQLVGFSDKATQLQMFLQAMNEAGYNEVFQDGQVGIYQTRNVPHRKWYTQGPKTQDAGNEVLLFHRSRN